MPTLRIQRKLRSIARFRHITLVLAKYGFDEVLGRIHLPLHVKGILTKRLGTQATGPERLVLAIEELGPTFIKFGQTLSMRSYLLPPEYGIALARLQDRVSPFPFEDVQKIIRDELGGDPSEVFREFEREPFASASIAQVHKAVLLTGEKVCVKVQRPGVRETLDLDIMILKDLAGLLETYVPESRPYDPSGIVSEFERTSRRETDFTTEAANLVVFKRNFEDEPAVYISGVFRQLSTSRVLTTEFIDGIKISDVDRLTRADVDVPDVARAGARAVLKQVFEDGLFHADPHPGNLFVMPDGRIAPVDFGIVGRLTRKEIDDLAEFLIAAVRRDGERLLAAMEKLNIIPRDVERRDVLEDVMLFLDKYGTRDLGDLNIKEVFTEFVSFMRRYRIKIKTEFMLLGKALSTYEEVGRALDLGFNMMAEAKPYVTRLLSRRRLFSSILGGGRSFGEIVSALSGIPGDLARVMTLAKDGRLKIEFEHLGLEKLTNELERSSSRISFSLIVAALVVASSLILVLGGDVFPYRWLGIAGFGFAAVVGIWLLIEIIRSGRV
ncbi:MAG: AarF/ABC1/UbiB kinase family protein [Candidatus Eisenbacteria bacterium]